MSPRFSLAAMALSGIVFTAGMVARPDASVARPAPTPAPAAPQVAKGNPAVGAKLFIQCRACHTVEVGGRNGVGPNLAGVMGAKAGFHPGFKYSPALEKAQIQWTPEKMDAWLTRPSALVPGNKMAFAGMSNPKARADVIAYLATLKGK